jgi:hypothetical protein
MPKNVLFEYPLQQKLLLKKTHSDFVWSINKYGHWEQQELLMIRITINYKLIGQNLIYLQNGNNHINKLIYSNNLKKSLNFHI